MEISVEFIDSIKKIEDWTAVIDWFDCCLQSLQYVRSNEIYEPELARLDSRINRVKIYMSAMQSKNFFDPIHPCTPMVKPCPPTARDLTRRYTLSSCEFPVGFYIIAHFDESILIITQDDLDCLMFDVGHRERTLGSKCILVMVEVSAPQCLPFPLSKIYVAGIEVVFISSGLPEMAEKVLGNIYKATMVSTIVNISRCSTRVPNRIVFSAMLEAIFGLRVGSEPNNFITTFQDVDPRGEEADRLGRFQVFLTGDGDLEDIAITIRKMFIIAVPQTCTTTEEEQGCGRRLDLGSLVDAAPRLSANLAEEDGGDYDSDYESY